jgi:hypothetical protein
MKSKKMRWAEYVARIVGKPEGEMRRGGPRRRWEDNIRMDLSEIDWKSVEWTPLAQDSGLL